MSLRIFSAAVLCSLIAVHPVFGLNNRICDGTTENPCVVQDTNSDSTEVRHWRTARMIHDTYKGNTAGLKHLWVSVSGAPSAADFKKIANSIEKATSGKYKKMIDLDLREESHAYLNKNAITLTNQYNWINLGKSHQQSIADEQDWVQSITILPYIFNVLSPKQFKAGQYTDGVDVKIKTLKSEQVIAEKAGFEYIRLTISDHMAPRDEDADRIVSLAKNLPDNVWVHMHCRGGDGRSTTVFAMYDMLKNADKVSFNDIIKRQASVFPYYDLSQIVRKDPGLTKYYKARLVFLNHFYQFASASIRGYPGNWSDWIKEQADNGLKNI